MSFRICKAAGVFWVAALAAQGASYVHQGQFVNPQSGSGIPGPTAVPGKEFFDNPNANARISAPVGQSVYWDGAGGTADAISYGGQVDSLANANDALSQALMPIM